jgi:hypothetical protein
MEKVTRYPYAERSKAKMMFVRGMTMTDVSKETGIMESTLKNWHSRDSWSRARSLFLQTLDEESIRDLRVLTQNTSFEFAINQMDLVKNLQDELMDQLVAMRELVNEADDDTVVVDVKSLKLLIEGTEKVQKMGTDIFAPPRNTKEVEFDPDSRGQMAIAVQVDETHER